MHDQEGIKFLQKKQTKKKQKTFDCLQFVHTDLLINKQRHLLSFVLPKASLSKKKKLNAKYLSVNEFCDISEKSQIETSVRPENFFWHKAF